MNASVTLRGAAAVRRTQPQGLRLFSFQPALQNQSQPESPRYVDIPRPVQESLPVAPRIKGFLPVPREIFSGKANDDHHLLRSLEGATKGPKNAAHNSDRRAAWERRMAVSRKRNLLEGTLELKHRKTRSEEIRAQRSSERSQDRERLLQAAMREDERLTAQSNNFNVQQLLSRIPLPKTRESRRIRHKTLEKKKRDQRMQDLQSLYTKAQSFIITTEQLDAAVETAFGTDEEPVFFEARYKHLRDAHSVWAFGKPSKLADKAEGLEMQNTSVARGGLRGSELNNLKRARVTRIVETLTGGDLGEDLTKTKKR